MSTIDPRMAEFAANFINESQRGLGIDGFGPDDPPPPEVSPHDLRGTQVIVDDEEEPAYNWPLPPVTAPQMQPNPLLDLGVKLTAPVPTRTIVNLPAGDARLFVAECTATYQEQTVELSTAERNAIAQIVLRAIVNRAKAQYDALVKGTPTVRVKRGRKADAQAQSGNEGGVRSGEGERGRADGQRQRRRRKPTAAHDEGSSQGAQETQAVQG